MGLSMVKRMKIRKEGVRYYEGIAQRALLKKEIPQGEAERILGDSGIEILPLLHAASRVRRRFFGKKVFIHIIDNARNGLCSEDCAYCVQGRSSSRRDLPRYAMKSDADILAEAEAAFEAGAFRHCIVFSGRGQPDARIRRIARLVREIKSRCPGMELCVSPGILGKGQAATLKAAGLDRLNHNLNTTEENYPAICGTHRYSDRLATIGQARKAGLAVCSGFIAGLGEGPEGIYRILSTLRGMSVASIPVNFLIPVRGTAVKSPKGLCPEYCLRVLCLARLMNPDADIRASAGREKYLGCMQPLAFHAATSVFVSGYLNVRGSGMAATRRMIREAGFVPLGEPKRK